MLHVVLTPCLEYNFAQRPVHDLVSSSAHAVGHGSAREHAAAQYEDDLLAWIRSSAITEAGWDEWPIHGLKTKSVGGGLRVENIPLLTPAAISASGLLKETLCD